jgi:general secretion pathway protein I
MPLRTKQKLAQGFTLLEVMVAMAIMAIVLVAVYRMHSQTLSMTAAARFQTEAPLLAQRKLAEIGSSADSFGSDSGDFGDDFEGYRWTMVVEDVVSEALGEVSQDLKRIDLTVTSDAGTFKIRTYRFMRTE